MTFVRIIFQIIIGLVFGFAAALALIPLIGSFSPAAGQTVTLVIVGLCTLLVAASPNLRRAFGRGFLVLGACVFMLPLSTFILSGVVTNDMVNTAASGDEGLAAVGGVVAGGMVTAFAGFVGFILGSILLLAGLILSLGGQREVVIVDRRSALKPRNTQTRQDPPMR